ncbi:MAG: lipoprotein signal peptidase [Muribaculaceae bacterium]|nr:lipoprotein signal peptidase [Muribaculaceae bacterium]
MLITAWIIVGLIIVIDQAVKIWIKAHFYLYENYEVTSWFHIVFVENKGMAFGLDFLNKYLLTFLRMGLFVFLVWYIGRLCKAASTPMGYLVSIALIAAGAMGNIIDCVFYGEIFNNPYPPAIAHFVPWGEGYGSLFQGRVVDMLHFPLCSWTWPSWLPWIGGNEFTFFDPVFNIADAAISVGMLAIVFFYFNQMEHSLENEKTPDTSDK